MNTYRCTRNKFSNIPILDRQGYYLDAPNEQAALKIMQRKFPDDKAGFTISSWLGERV